MKQPLLITDKQPAIRINFKPCKDKPNHTTYEHPKGLVWQPFTSSFTNFPRRTPTQGFRSYLLTPGCESAAFRLISPSSLPLIWGYVQYSVRHFQSVKYCELHRFTGPIKRHVTSTVQWLDHMGKQRTGLNRHKRGYATKERVHRHVPFLVSGPIGLARSQLLNSIFHHH